MKDNRAKKAIYNVLTGIIYQLTNIIVNFIIAPLIILKFGSATNGIVQSIRQILNYVQFVGAGISESTVVSLYDPLAKNDKNKVSSIINACDEVFVKSGLIYSIGSLITAILYPFIFSINLSKFSVFFLVLVLSVAGASEFFIMGKYRALLTADQKIYIVNVVQSIGLVLSLVATYILIKLDMNIVVVQLGLSLAYVSRVLFLVIYISRTYVFLDKKIKKDFSALENRKAATVHQLAGIITFGSQIIVASYFCGSKEASVYSVYTMIFTGINTLLGVFSSALLAFFGELFAIKNKEKIREHYRVYELGYFTLVFLVYSVTYSVALDFIKLYTSGILDVNYVRFELMTLFSIMGLVNCMRTPGATLINAIGHYSETKNRALIEMVICFVGQLILVNYYGLSGILIATITAYIYRTIDVIVYVNNRILNQKFLFTLKTLIVNGLAGAIFIKYISVPDRIINNYFDWIICASINVLFCSIIFIFINSMFNMEMLIKLNNTIKRKQ